MVSQILSQHLDTSRQEIEALLQLSMDDLFQNSTYHNLLKGLDTEKLYATLQEARRVLDNGLPPVVKNMMDKHHLDHFPLSTFMLSNWVVGFLQYPDHLENLLSKHDHVPVSIIREVVPEVFYILSKMKSGRQEWEHAFATLVIPLVSEARN